MQQDLQLTGMSERTAEAYLRAVRKLAAHARKSPDLFDEEELRAYFYYIRSDQLWEPSTIRVTYSGINFFYQHTCPRDWPLPILLPLLYGSRVRSIDHALASQGVL